MTNGRRQAMTTADFRCDLSQQGTGLLHCWEHTVGSCHAPIALRADWQQQPRRCQSELGFRYVRFHGLLSDDVGVEQLHEASRMVREACRWLWREGRLTFEIELAPHGVAALTVEFVPS